MDIFSKSFRQFFGTDLYLHIIKEHSAEEQEEAKAGTTAKGRQSRETKIITLNVFFFFFFFKLSTLFPFFVQAILFDSDKLYFSHYPTGIRPNIWLCYGGTRKRVDM